MFRFIFITAIWLLSCGQETSTKQGALEDLVIEEVKPPADTLSESKGVFHWSGWDWSKGDIYLTDDLLKYVAKGHVGIDGSYSDLNEDGILDLVVVTGLPKEDSLQFSPVDLPRHPLVFLGQENGSKRFAFRNTKAIPCINCCGMTDPYAGHTATTGKLIINQYCGSSWKSISEYRFRYIPKLNDWYLDTVVTESYSFNFENYALDTSTQKDFGKVSLKTFVINDDGD